VKGWAVAVGAREVLQKTGEGSEVEDTHPFIAQVKGWVHGGLHEEKIITPCCRQHIPMRRRGRIAGLKAHGGQQGDFRQGYLLIVIGLSGAPCLQRLQCALVPAPQGVYLAYAGLAVSCG